MTLDTFDGLLPILIGIALVGLVIWRVFIEFRERGKSSEIEAEKKQPKESFRRKIIRLSKQEYFYPKATAPWVLFIGIVILGLIVGLIVGAINYFSSEQDFSIAFQAFKEASQGFSLFLFFLFFLVVPANLLALLMSLFSRDFNFLLRGNRMHGQSNYDKALEHFEKAVSIFPSEYGYYKVGLMKMKIEEEIANKANRKPDYTEALIYFDKSIESKLPHYRAFVERSNIRRYIYDIEGAFSDIENARKLDVKDYHYNDRAKAEIYDKQAEALEMMGDRDKAIECYSLAIKLTPHDFKLNEKRGKLRHWNKDYKGAISDYLKVVTSSKYVEHMPNYLLMVLHRVLGEYEKYIELRKSIISLKETEENGRADYMRKDLAELMFERGDYEGASGIYKEVSNFDKVILNKYKSAKHRFDSFVNNNQKEGDSFESLFSQALYFEKFGHLQQAIECLDAASEYIEYDNQKAKYYYYSGMFYDKIWDYGKAEIAFGKARVFDKENKYIGLYHYIARIKKDQANYEEALKIYLKYIDLRKEQELEIKDQMCRDIIDISIACSNYERALEFAEILESDTNRLYKIRTEEVSRIIEKREKLLKLQTKNTG